ncbi:MAG: hypothetical protein ACXVB6_07875 [Mucilaginibacter sp.]
MKLKLLSFCFLLGACHVCCAQLQQFTFTSANTSFPDTARAKGHIYHDSLYRAADNYSDSSVIVITPKNFAAGKTIDLVFWFHGWNNNIDSALVRYGLSRQFAEAGINAVLVLAETAKDAPDSYGGKLEEENRFSKLVNDVMKKLAGIHLISPLCKVGNIVLAGHSGAYRVMANIVQNGNLPVQEVILFDALYAETPKFLNWLSNDQSHRFINLYTDHGGTYDETKAMMQQLGEQHFAIDSTEETNLTPALLQANKIIFIHTLHQHNDIIQHPDNFKLFIENSPFLKPKARK